MFDWKLDWTLSSTPVTTSSYYVLPVRIDVIGPKMASCQLANGNPSHLNKSMACPLGSSVSPDAERDVFPEWCFSDEFLICSFNIYILQIISYYITIHYIILYCIISYYTILYYIILYHIKLYHILYYTIL